MPSAANEAASKSVPSVHEAAQAGLPAFKSLKPFLKTDLESAHIWSGLLDAQTPLEQVGAHLARAYKRSEFVGLVAFIVYFGVGAPGLLSWIAPESLAGLAGALVLAVLMFSLAGLVMMMCSADLVFRGDTLRAIRENLTPLSKRSKACLEARELLASPRVRRYRDFVVEGGRELVMGDFKVMQAIARDEARQGEAERVRQACQELHGIATMAEGASFPAPAAA